MARRVDLNDIKEAIQTIEEDGGVILTKFSGIADIEKVNRDAAPFISTIMTDVSVSFHSSPITHSPLEDICHPKVSHIIDEASHQRASKALPPETTRCTRLFGRSTTARETWLQQPSLQAILKHFLRTVSKPDHWKEEDAARLATDPILSAASTLSIGPDVKAQSLHRDDFIWQQTHKTEQKTYNLGSDVGMGLLVAGVKTTKSNGATLVRLRAHVLFSILPIGALWVLVQRRLRAQDSYMLISIGTVCARISSVGWVETNDDGGGRASGAGGWGGLLIPSIHSACRGSEHYGA